MQKRDGAKVQEIKAQDVLAKILRTWPELAPLAEKIKTRLTVVAEDLEALEATKEEYDLLFEEIADRSAIWPVADRRSLSPDARLSAVTRLLEISPSEYEEACRALEKVWINAQLLTEGEEGFDDYVQALAMKIRKDEQVGTLLGTIWDLPKYKLQSFVIKESRFSKLPEIEANLLKAIGSTFETEEVFSAGSTNPLSQSEVAAQFCAALAGGISPDDVEIYLQADALGTTRIPLTRVSILFATLYELSRSRFLEMAHEIVQDSNHLQRWFDERDDESQPTEWVLADMILENSHEDAVELALNYVKIEKQRSSAAMKFNNLLAEHLTATFQLNPDGRSRRPKYGDDGVRRGKWHIDTKQSRMFHTEHPDRYIELKDAAREALVVIFEKMGDDDTEMTFDPSEILIESHGRLKEAGKAKSDTTPQDLKDSAFSGSMNIFWGKNKLLGSTVRRRERDERYAKYLGGDFRIDLRVPFPKPKI